MKFWNNHRIKHFPGIGLVKSTDNSYTIGVGCVATRRTGKGNVRPIETSPEKERVMKTKLMLFLPVFCLFLLLAPSLSAVELKNTSSVTEVTRGDLNVSVRLIGGKGAVLRKGRNIELTCQSE